MENFLCWFSYIQFLSKRPKLNESAKDGIPTYGDMDTTWVSRQGGNGHGWHLGNLLYNHFALMWFPSTNKSVLVLWVKIGENNYDTTTGFYLFIYFLVYLSFDILLYLIVVKMDCDESFSFYYAHCFCCQASVLSDLKSRPCVCSFFVTVTLICGAYFIGNAYVAKENKEVCMSHGLASFQILLIGHIDFSLWGRLMLMFLQ